MSKTEVTPKQTDRILSRVTTPGRYTLTVKVPMRTGAALSIPVHVIKGRRKGPVCAVLAGEHGVEVNGVAAIDRVVRETDPRSLRGTLVGVPVVNPVSVRSRTFPGGTPSLSAWNSFSAWPGDPQGSPAERIAAALVRAVVDDADVVINIHAWSWYSASCVFTSPRNSQAVRLAKVFGLPFVCFGFHDYCGGAGTPLHPKHNKLTHYVMARGGAAMLVELRTQYWLYPPSVADGMNGIRNVMKTLGMLPGKAVRPAVQHEALNEEFVRAPRPGLFVPVKDLADRVRKHEVLGYLLDLKTGGKTDVRSPCNGAVWLVSRVGEGPVALSAMHAYADKGDLLALIKHVRTARPRSRAR